MKKMQMLNSKISIEKRHNELVPRLDLLSLHHSSRSQNE